MRDENREFGAVLAGDKGLAGFEFIGIECGLRALEHGSLATRDVVAVDCTGRREAGVAKKSFLI